MSISDLYEREIRPLPWEERIELAARIVAELPAEAAPSYHEEWSDDAMEQFAVAAFAHGDRLR